MNKTLKLSLLGIILSSAAFGKTIFFPTGPQKFNVTVPLSVYTTPKTQNGLPVQLAVLGKEGDTVYVFDGNPRKEIKTLDANRIPKELSQKAEAVENIKASVKNIFLQGTIPKGINFLPGEFEKSGNGIQVSDGIFKIPAKDKNTGAWCQITSNVFLEPQWQWVIIKYEAKSENPDYTGNTIKFKDVRSFEIYKTETINQKWSTQLMIIPVKPPFLEVRIDNLRNEEAIEIRNIQIFPF